uniref:Uncharacterized protein n=1 Tax=Vespula pensylvanica TaxID=30213 RepID=A0A834UBY0_VESPE|nr:hypothetical protein H0235_005770 [Vespula pensylvanica]
MTQVRNKFNEVRFLSYIYVFPSILAKQLSQYQTTELSFGRLWSIQTIPSSWIKQNPKHYEEGIVRLFLCLATTCVRGELDNALSTPENSINVNCFYIIPHLNSQISLDEQRHQWMYCYLTDDVNEKLETTSVFSTYYAYILLVKRQSQRYFWGFTKRKTTRKIK